MERVNDSCCLTFRESIDKENRIYHKMERRKRLIPKALSFHLSLYGILFLLKMNCIFVQAYEQKFALEPQDQTVIVGSKLVLPCRIVNKSGQLQWTKDDFGLGTHRNLSGYERYSMIGSDEEGDFSLEINPVHLEDDAKYQCQVSAGSDGQQAIRSRYAKVNVLVAPDPPRILQGPILYATEDQEVDLECVSSGGKPAAEITWQASNGMLLTDRARYSTQLMSDGIRFTARSVLSYRPSRTLHNGNITCQAQNTADSVYKSTTIEVQVRYAPVVTTTIISGASKSGRIPEGSEVRLNCTADANPKDLTYRWFLNDEEVVGDYTTEVVFFNVTKKNHDSIVKCEVHNAIGKSEDSKTLDVTYRPKFRQAPIDVSADVGGSVTMTCDVDGNPQPEITWLHEEQDRWSVVGTTPNLTVTADSSTSGRYTCKALVSGYPEIQADASLYLKGAPRIVSPHNQMGIPGEAAKVECHIISVPRPVHLVWTFQGREINTHHDPDYTLMEEPLSDGIKSVLVIRHSQDRHYGAYNCSVTNEYGSDVQEIQLIAQTIFSTLLLGVLGGVLMGIFIVGVIVCICCYGRRSRDMTPKGETISKNKPDVMMDAMDRTLSISKLDLKHKDEEYGSELPLTGPVPLPDKSLMMQYVRYSNDYSDHTFNSSLDYKDGHNNNGYSSYVDFSRDYNPPRLHPMQGSLDNHSIGRLSLQQTPSGAMSVSSSLQRKMKGDANSIGIPSATYEPIGSLSNGYLKSSGSGLLSPGVDIRYAATYGNPYLRTQDTVNTANPAATPAPPPYNSIRNSTLCVLPVGSSPTLSPIGLGSQQQAAPQTKKSPSGQPSLATHV